MLTYFGKKTTPFCDGLSRRSFLRLGTAAMGAASISMPQVLQAEAAGSRNDHAVVMIYLPGGPTQHETFDPKPDAPVEIRGSYQPIATKVPGVQFCELLPKLAGMSDKFSVIRSLVGMVNRHESFHTYTGRAGGRPGDGEPAGGWPTFGSTVSYVLGDNQGVIPYVDAAPKMSHRPYNNHGFHDPAGTSSWPGYTGRAHTPLTINGKIKDDLTLNGVDDHRFGERRELLSQLGQLRGDASDDSLSVFQQQAYEMLTSSRLADALDLDKEDPKVLNRYGEGQATDPSFGGAPQSPRHLLQARRLVEAGVRCVTVAFGAGIGMRTAKGRLSTSRKSTCRSLTMHCRVLGRFGRAWTAGTDERRGVGRVWPHATHQCKRRSRSLARYAVGVGRWRRHQGGQVIGQTDRVGGVPIERPVHVQEVFATLYRTLGIDVNSVKIPRSHGAPSVTSWMRIVSHCPSCLARDVLRRSPACSAS